jgi:serine/threonine protein kinase
VTEERPRETKSSVPPYKQRLGRYTLVHRLGSGGMAEVWLARQDGPAGGRPVAVKRMLSHLAYDPRASQMFLDEARIASQVSHPNVVQIFDVGREEDTYYLVMEFVLGENCARIIDRAKKRKVPIPTVLAARICAEAAKGLHHAHTRQGPGGRPLGIIHRDVTPPNIMVTDDGEVKVLDFGIARAVDRLARTEAGNVKGRVEYLSPEQIEGAQIDHRADVFALGAVLFELCTQKKLFARETMVATLAAVTECKVTPPSRIAKHTDPRIDEIVLKATAKRPDDRYQNAQEMREALIEFLRGRETRAGSAELAQFVGDLFRDEQEERKRVLETVYQSEDGTLPEHRPESLVKSIDPLAKAIDRALDDKPRGRSFEVASEDPTLVSPVQKNAAIKSLRATPAPPPRQIPSIGETAPMFAVPAGKSNPPKDPASIPPDHEPAFSLSSVSLPAEDDDPTSKPRAWFTRSSVLIGGGLLSLAVAGAIVGGTLFYRYTKQTTAGGGSARDPSSGIAAADEPDGGVIFAPEISLDPESESEPEDAGLSVDAGPADLGLRMDGGSKRGAFAKSRATTSTATANRKKGSVYVLVRGEGKEVHAGILLDGEWVGLSPIEVRAETGPHLLEVRQDGWRVQKRAVLIEPGRSSAIAVNLDREGEAPIAASEGADTEPAPEPVAPADAGVKKKPKKKPVDLDEEVEIEVGE